MYLFGIAYYCTMRYNRLVTSSERFVPFIRFLCCSDRSIVDSLVTLESSSCPTVASFEKGRAVSFADARCTSVCGGFDSAYLYNKFEIFKINDISIMVWLL